jgi:hypothetical protein
LPDTPLPEETVVDYDLDAVHGKIAALRSRGMVANGQELFDLLVYDAYTGFTTTLQAETIRLTGLRMAPDGLNVSFLDSRIPQGVYVQTSGSSSPTRQVGTCQAGGDQACRGPVWSADSRQLAWSDPDGVWVYHNFEQQTSLLITSSLTLEDLDGQPATIRVTFDDLQWSPAGRYLSAWVQPHPSETGQQAARWRGVLDMRSGRVVEIPGTYQPQPGPANTLWMRDGRLLVTRSAGPDNPVPVLETWLVLPASQELLVFEKRYPLALENVTGLPELPADAFIPSLPAQAGGNLFSILISAPESGILPVLALYDLRLAPLRLLGEAPADTRAVIWSPDGEAALVISQNESARMALASGGLFDLEPLLGNARQVAWLP